MLAERGRFDGASDVITIDGLRVEYNDGFGLMRPSNTAPMIVLRFRGGQCRRTQAHPRCLWSALLAANSELQLPF